jgi:hypothetical protein
MSSDHTDHSGHDHAGGHDSHGHDSHDAHPVATDVIKEDSWQDKALTFLIVPFAALLLIGGGFWWMTVPLPESTGHEPGVHEAAPGHEGAPGHEAGHETPGASSEHH